MVPLSMMVAALVAVGPLARSGTLALLAGGRIPMGAVLGRLVLVVGRASLGVRMAIQRGQRDRAARTSEENEGGGRRDGA
jgi:hypothetical protein